MSARRCAAVLGAYLLLALVATFPLVLHATDHVCGVSAPPGGATQPLNIWAMAMVLRHLPLDPLHLFDGTAFYPYSGTVAFSEHLFVPALIGAPVVALTGNHVLAYNVVCLVTLATAGLGMFLLARHLTGDAAAAFVAGALYAFHTWNINELARIQILSNQWFPFLLLALLRFYESPSLRRAALAGLFYVLESLSCMYWALYLPLLVGASVLVLQWRHRPGPKVLARLALGLLPAALLTGVFLVPYVQADRRMGFERPLPNSVPVDRYFDVLPENDVYAAWLGTARLDQSAAHFLGFLPLGLGLAGIVAARRRPESASLVPLLVLLVVAGFLLSLGPEISWRRHVLGPGPYVLLRRLVPGFRSVRYPERFSVFVVLGLGPLMAFALARLRARVGIVGVALAGVLVFAEHLSVPQSLSFIPTGAEIPSVYRWLAQERDVPAVAEVPASRYKMERADALPMYLSIVHGQRTLQGYTGYFPATYFFIKWRLFHFPEPDSVRFLERIGATRVVVSPDATGAAPEWVKDDPRWALRRFPEGHVALTLRAGEPYPPPAAAEAGYTEIAREGWRVQASRGDARKAIDGDLQTQWTTEEPQGQGDFFRIRLPQVHSVARIVLELAPPIVFPAHLQVLGGREGEDDWGEQAFDAPAAYDRLFSVLLHDPRHPRLTLELPGRPVDGLRLRISETDGYWMPFTIAEVRLYEKR